MDITQWISLNGYHSMDVTQSITFLPFIWCTRFAQFTRITRFARFTWYPRPQFMWFKPFARLQTRFN
jgi:hypothetical protein